MFQPKILLLLAFVVPFHGTAQQKRIEHVPISRASWASGQEMYMAYCAACHGKDAKGGGPAAEALKVPPTDLTAMAKLNNGSFPQDHVRATIQGDVNLPAHGSKEMPVWGRVFLSVSTGQVALVHQRVYNLTHYIETLQAK
jgi:mono/diheme cytochrome c family protein